MYSPSLCYLIIRCFRHDSIRLFLILLEHYPFSWAELHLNAFSISKNRAKMNFYCIFKNYYLFTICYKKLASSVGLQKIFSKNSSIIKKIYLFQYIIYFCDFYIFIFQLIPFCIICRIEQTLCGFD